jgi:hypothetical protein
LKSIKADGTNDTALASFTAGNITAVAPNPTKPNQFAFASFNSTTLKYKLYKGSAALDPASSVLLTSTTYDAVDDVEFTPDGAYVIFKADAGTGYKLYRVAVGGGSAVALDDVFEFSVSPVVGSNLIAYSKPLATTSEVYTIDYLTSTQTQVTNLGIDVYSPTWSRDGANILFGYTADPLVDNIHLFNTTYPGGTVTEVTPVSAYNEPFGFYNENMTKVAVVRSGIAGVFLSVYDITGASYFDAVTNDSLGPVCYWTDSTGRAASANIPHFKFGKRNHR